MTFKQYSFTIYNIGLLLMAASLPLWMLLMSISQFILVGAWMMDGNIQGKLKKAFSNPVVLSLTGLFFIHVIGLLNTTDFDYALRDIRIKLPLLLLPVVFSTMPALTENQFNNVLKTVILATFISTMCSIAILLGFTSRIVTDARDISVFISHIRLSLIICVAIAAMVYFLSKKEKGSIKFIYIILITWFIIFLAILESLTGLAILSILAIIWCLSLLWKNKSRNLRPVMMLSLAVILAGLSWGFWFVFIDSVKKITVPHALKQYTAAGHPYIHLTDRQDHENGNLVWINICEFELDSAWNKKSHLNYYGKDLREQDIKYTLIRYLTSKNYSKDAAGIKLLTTADIAAIEQGIPNINYLRKSDLGARFQQLAWEYRNYYYSGNPSGHSAMQRLEFWKTAVYIIKNNPWAGVGTGDIQQEFKNAYVEMKSQLLPQFRFHSHNEYLTMAVAFGIPGGLYFIFSLFFPYIYLNKRKDLLYTAFLIILLLSMLTEDTPETQAGATFMAFFNAFFLFHPAPGTTKT